MQTGDTITAIASPPADAAARGLIRLSGPSAFEILQVVLAPKERTSLTFQRTITTTTLRLEPATTHQNNPSVNLRCIVALYPAPQSYTAENSVEIITVGNRHLLHRILQKFLAAGARTAEPGEFTARAYFNGRLTLAQAEGVAATITAASEAQLRAAQLLTEGTLGKICRSLSDRLTNALALVEAGIDFVDQEDVVPISTGRLYHEIKALRQEIDELTEHAVARAQLSAIPRVVIVGPPNAGKSTLFNALLKRKRAVVSPISGTTRDALVEPLHLHPADPHSPEVLLIDLAGLDLNDTNFFNPKMQAAAQDAIATADLIINLHPADQPSTQSTPLQGWGGGGDAALPLIQVRSKCDLVSPELENPGDTHKGSVYDLEISRDDERGLDNLRTLIRDRLQKHTAILAADALALEPRHHAALADARAHLAALADDLREQAETQPHSFIIDSEFVAAHLRLPLAALGQITGNQVTPDEVLGQIFAGFCIGK